MKTRKEDHAWAIENNGCSTREKVGGGSGRELKVSGWKDGTEGWQTLKGEQGSEGGYIAREMKVTTCLMTQPYGN